MRQDGGRRARDGSPSGTGAPGAATISAALIVRNEAHTLARCLDSVRDAVDEIVVVDTGSADGTRDVARRFTERVYEFRWRCDFAAARAFSFAQATCEWVFWVDADDVVLHADRIRPAVAAAGPD